VWLLPAAGRCGSVVVDDQSPNRPGAVGVARRQVVAGWAVAGHADGEAVVVGEACQWDAAQPEHRLRRRHALVQVEQALAPVVQLGRLRRPPPRTVSAGCGTSVPPQSPFSAIPNRNRAGRCDLRERARLQCRLFSPTGGGCRQRSAAPPPPPCRFSFPMANAGAVSRSFASCLTPLAAVSVSMAWPPAGQQWESGGSAGGVDWCSYLLFLIPWRIRQTFAITNENSARSLRPYTPPRASRLARCSSSQAACWLTPRRSPSIAVFQRHSPASLRASRR
jgi:hypothetical protein